MSLDTPGGRLRGALDEERPLQMVGAINAYAALLAEQAGFRAIYLSGSGVAAASYGLPDIGLVGWEDVLEDARRITSATSLPLLVDLDTGGQNPLTAARAVRELARAGVAGVHIEDQVSDKRCGHLPDKVLVSIDEMSERMTAAVAAKPDADFVVMARTDAVAGEGMNGALARVRAYEAAGADMIFAEACRDLDDYRRFVDAVDVPVLANLTEFGVTPLFTVDELRGVGIAVALYPLSAFRAMSRTASDVYRGIRAEGTQRGQLERMQTRDELYRRLRYEEYDPQVIARWRETAGPSTGQVSDRGS